MEPKRTQKVVIFAVLKSYEFIAKNRVRRTTRHLKNVRENKCLYFYAKMRFFTTYCFTSAKLRFVRFRDQTFQFCLAHFVSVFFETYFSSFS